MAKKLNVTVPECKEILKQFFEAFPKIKEFTAENERLAREKGYVEDYMGRRRHLPDASLPELEVRAVKHCPTDIDIFPDTVVGNGENEILPVIDIPDKQAIEKWTEIWEKCEQSGEFRAKQRFKEAAQKECIPLQDNGAFISKTLTQCTNARIQGCLTYETKIATRENGIIEIGKLANQSVTVWDGKEWSKAIVLPSGQKQKCRISFYNGVTIYCSPDHKFLVQKAHGKTSFEKLSKLKEGDMVCVCDTMPDGTKFAETHTKVLAVEITDEYIPMYDVCNTERGYFVANGIITHNSAATLTKKAMIAISRDKQMQELGFKMLIPVHDELLGECPAENAEKVCERLSYLMCEAAKPECSVNMKVDTYVVRRWYANEFSAMIAQLYKKLQEGNEKEGIAPMTADDAFKKIVTTYPEIALSTLRKMCDKEYDVLSYTL